MSRVFLKKSKNKLKILWKYPFQRYKKSQLFFRKNVEKQVFLIKRG